MFNIDIEKKLNDLKEGNYKKSLNNKVYEIKVKNLDNNTKLITVYNNDKLIGEFNYYKDGKVLKEGNIMKDDKNYTLDNIIEKMINLSEGSAKLDNISISVKKSKKIDDNSSTPFNVEIEDDEYFYDFKIPFTNEYFINIKSKKEDFILYTSQNKTSKEKDNRSLMFTYNNKKYALTNTTLTNLYDERKYFIHNNSLVTKIDDKTYIGYNFENNKVYVYSKKKDSINNDLDKDYYKSIYIKNLAKTGNMCIDFLDVMKSKLKEKIEDKEFNEIIDNVKINKFNSNLDAYYDDIIEMANLYMNNVKYLNILDNQEIIDCIYNLVNNANISIVDKKINDFKDNINNQNLKELNTLYSLRKDLKEIIKLKKKETRTKKKILKNTDIEA